MYAEGLEALSEEGSYSNDVGGACGISELLLQNFRSYKDFSLSVRSQTIVITGPNGAGKTNILEALSLLSPGRGLRGAKLSQMTHLPTQQGNPQASWALSARLSSTTGDVTLGTGLRYTPQGSERRLVKIQGEPVKSQEALTAWISVLWMGPEQDRLFIDTAGARRRFIDRMVYALDPEHAHRLHRYEHHIRERALLLQQDRYDPQWIGVLEGRIAADGVAIIAGRSMLLEHLIASQSMDPDYPFPAFQAKMMGTVESWLETQPALAVEEAFAEQLVALRVRDRHAGGAGMGPHRSDLEVIHLRKNLPASLCSTGEQKMMVLALVLAFARIQLQQRDTLTVLLLDDVIAHLDEHHRHVLFREIGPEAGLRHTQVWMTGAEKEAFDPLIEQAQFIMF